MYRDNFDCLIFHIKSILDKVLSWLIGSGTII